VDDTVNRLNTALAGRYRVERQVGEGGMSVVYLAEDLRHNRRVALKVLKPDVANTLGPERFVREVAIASRLAHPHVVPLYDSGEADGLLYYVMPFVEGESLRQRMARPLPREEAIRLLSEVADALAWAHRQGIVHRDIKPENVMLSAGHAVVTDFGIAKAISLAADVDDEATAGVALGTPAYMSPEQVSADPGVDHRTDIYSFGILAYELLTGHTPFRGDTKAATAAAHLTKAPEPLPSTAGIPPALADLVMRCLEKDPDHRPQHAVDLVHALERLRGGIWSRQAMRVGLVVGGGAVAVALLLVWFATKPDISPLLGHATVIASGQDLEVSPEISPDGRWVAYSAGNSFRMSVWVRPSDGSRPIRLTTDTSVVTVQPRWSPDGTRILYGTREGLWLVPAPNGGPPRRIAEALPGQSFTSGAWSPDGSEIAVPIGDSLFILPVDGGPRRAVGAARELHSCDWSPSARWIACVSGNSPYVRPGALLGNVATSVILLFNSSGGEAIPVTDGEYLHQSPSWGATDHELYYVSDIDGPRDAYLQHLTRSGSAEHPAHRITTELDAFTVDVSRDGTQMAYAVYTTQSNLWTLPIPRHGVVSDATARQLTFENQSIESMTVTRDGRWLLFDSDLSGNRDIYRMPLPEGEVERLTSDPGGEYAPEQSPDGRTVAYHAAAEGSREVFLLPLDNRVPQQITSTAAQEARPTWSPDGNRIAMVDLRLPGAVLVTTRDTAGHWQAPVRVDSGGAAPDFGCVPAPDWDDRGSALVYCYDGTIRVLHLGHGPTTVYAPRAASDDPVVDWTRAGVGSPTVFFRGHRRSGEDGIWRVPLAGGAPELLVRFDDQTRPSPLPGFAADRSDLYFTRSERQSDIRVATLERP